MSNLGIFDIELLKVDEIIIVNAAIDNQAGVTNLEKNNYFFDTKYAFDTAVSITSKKLRIIFTADIEMSTQNKTPIGIKGKFEIAFFFHYEELDRLAVVDPESKGEKSAFDVNDDLLMCAANIAYSTSRGIIYTRCQGTVMTKVILPILPTNKLAEALQ